MQSWFLLGSSFLCVELLLTSVNQNDWERWRDLFATTHQRPTPTYEIFLKVILEVPGTANTSNPGFDHNLVISTSFSHLVCTLSPDTELECRYFPIQIINACVSGPASCRGGVWREKNVGKPLVSYQSRWSFSFILGLLHWSSSWQWQPCIAGCRFF